MARSGLSCTNCRQRKVRCNRSLPICERCHSLELECNYPSRQLRDKSKQPSHSNGNDHGTLAAILERLRRVEARASGSTSEQSSPTTVMTSPDSASLAVAHPQDVPGSSTCMRCAPPKTGPTSSSARGAHAASSSIQNSIADMDSESSDAQPLDVTSVLSFSINQLQQLVKRQTSGIGALTTEGISIPPESAKRWINNYYLNMDGKLLPALVDRKLIDMMPDLITMEHVHLDACILLIYYCILWQGCFFLKSNSCKSPDRRYARQIFICCLRTIPIWKQESSGSVTDFIAAMYMTQTAVENFDFGLSWDMHKLACEYAHALRMHSLDGGPCNDLAGEPVISDDDRMGLWDLIHLDLFYRLINNKPAAFPASLDDWRVNMPWLSVECSQAQEEAVPTMAFLARTRLTFVLMRFFQVSETTTSEEEALEVIMPLCEEVETIIEEWKMEEWMQSYSGDDLNSWILGNLALSAYTCILFMLRKATLPNSNEHRPLLSDTDDMIPRNDMSMRISRKVLRVVHLMIQVVGLPGPESISLFLGNYRAYVAHAHLASGLLLDPASPTAEEDFLLLTQVADCVDTVTREGAEFMPLGRSLKYVNREVEKRVFGEARTR